LAVASGMSRILFLVIPSASIARGLVITPAFAVSTTMLFTGSWCLYLAIQSVRREHQQLFRRWLHFALAAGTVFVAVQSFALSRYILSQSSDDAETGTAAFVAMFAGLHGLHFVVALLFLCFVTVQAMADRYDHEYYWGVTICAWFWHVLGIAWIAILFVMVIARFFTERRLVV
jgi:cytochrome c oxidase subunit 3